MVSKSAAKINSHPLCLLAQDYFKRYEKLRDDYQDLSNLQFHNENALIISGPNEWPYYYCIKSVCDVYFKSINKIRKDGDVVIVYPSSDAYKELYEILGRDISYISLTEIYYAVEHRKKEKDILTDNSHIWYLLKNSVITFVLDVDDIYNVKNDVIDVIKTYTHGALAILG